MRTPGEGPSPEPGNCVSDPIFAEVDEEVRREQLKQLWAKYGTLFIAAACIIVLAVAGLGALLQVISRAVAGCTIEPQK